MDDLQGVRRAGADPLRRRAAAAPGHLRHRAARQGDGLLRRPVDQRHADRRRDMLPTIAARRLRLRRHQPRRHRGDARPLPPQGRAPSRRRSPACACAAMRGIKVGMRFTLTQDNAHDLPGAARADGGRGHRQVLPVAPQLRRARQHQPQDRRRVPHDHAPAMDLLFDAGWRASSRRQADASSSPATTTPTASTCCTGCASAFPSARRTCAPSSRSGAATPPASTSPTSTTSATSTPTPSGGTTPRQRAGSGRSPRSGTTRPIRSWPASRRARARSRGAAARCALLRHLRRQHPRARLAAHRRCVGRGPGLLPRRRRDRHRGRGERRREAVHPRAARVKRRRHATVSRAATDHRCEIAPDRVPRRGASAMLARGGPDLRSRAVIASSALAAGTARPSPSGANYATHCASCHGADRLGGMGPALLPENLERLRKPAAAETIAEGRLATQMPAFARQAVDGARSRRWSRYVYAPPAQRAGVGRRRDRGVSRRAPPARHAARQAGSSTPIR